MEQRSFLLNEFHNGISDMTDPRPILYGLLACVHYGWDICAGRQWHRVPFLVVRAVSHVIFVVLCGKDKDTASATTSRLIHIGTAIFLLIGAYEKAQELPTIWDSDAWALQMDTVMGFWLLVNSSFMKSGKGLKKSLDSPVIFPTIRDMMASYYFAAAFWKVNSHFMDPDGSCATMFLVQMVVNYGRPVIERLSSTPQETMLSIAAMTKAWAPISALAVELLVGGCMVAGSVLKLPRIQALGCLLALSFHLMVCFLPAPNDISGFALNCAPRHIVFASSSGTVAALGLVKKHLLSLSTVVAVGVAIGAQSNWTENNWAFFWYVLVGGFVATSIVMEDENKSDKTTNKPATAKRRSLWSHLAVSVAIFYSFGTLMLGLQEESTANMFANLRMSHGGSDHYFLPTGLLFHWFVDAPDTHPFGGGVIRIENTTSDWLRTIYPADLTAFLQPPGIVEVMEAIGSEAPIYFNPGANRNLGLLQDVPGRFYRYTIPALEFKRLLHEAKERDGSFSLTYSKLPGAQGDEVWRATATESTVSLEVIDGIVQDCKTGAHGSDASVPCSKDALPYVDFDESVPWILRRLSLYHAYPIVVDAGADPAAVPKSIRCFGP